MYVVRVVLESDPADSKAFDNLQDARRHFQHLWSWQSPDGLIYDIQSVAIYEVEAAADAKAAVHALEEANKESVRLIEVISSQDLPLCRWYLTEVGLTDVTHLSTTQIVCEARERAARLEALGPSFAQRVPRKK